MKTLRGENIKIICKNRKAFFNFEVDDSFECGIVLLGSEVKSLRNGKANISDSYGKIRKGEIFLIDAHISPYEQSNRQKPRSIKGKKTSAPQEGDQATYGKSHGTRFFFNTVENLL